MIMAYILPVRQRIIKESTYNSVLIKGKSICFRIQDT